MQRHVVVVLLIAATSFAVNAQELVRMATHPEADYSPYIHHDIPTQVLFGDTHLHTAYSADAGLTGALTNPEDAYRFAKGETVKSSHGIPTQLQRPLDFLVVADHAENLGLLFGMKEKNEALLSTKWGRDLVEIFAPGTAEAMAKSYVYWGTTLSASQDPEDPLAGTGFNETMWQRMTAAAEKHNQPGAFTALIGYEWTSSPQGNNLHRNVVFRDGKVKADQVVPFSSYDSLDPEDLWGWMESYEKKTGGRVLAIPHNGNLSNGLMFDDVTLTGKKPIDREYAKRRMQFEPIYEITQIKGDGETHPALSPNDEFSDYGTWDKGSFGAELKTPDMLPREYAREAWKRGLRFESTLGANAFKFGVVGSTDSHTGLATTQEDNFFGKAPMVEPTSDPVRFEEAITGRLTPDDPTDDITHGQALASGLAAVWARENTREAVWDAFKRKEVFATTGTRMRVRVFAGWDFESEDLNRSDFAEYGYSRGVPMGGDLSVAPDGKSPGLLIRAIRDPDGANLDRVQVIKGWIDGKGETYEKVFDVAWSGDRQPDKNGKLPGVGSTVNVAQASYSNSIGAAWLQSFWRDPEFDPRERAFYYLRVLEIPTPRWTTYDAKYFDIELLKSVSPTHQERAYTSPIWYTP